MNEPDEVTGYADVDHVLHWFLAQVQVLLGTEFVGMYLVGSLALGDFDPANSDIDFIIVTKAQLAPALIAALRDMHTRIDQSTSPWAGRIEAVYVERDALHIFPPGEKAYPQVEKGRGLFVEPLEMGWNFERWTLREHGAGRAGTSGIGSTFGSGRDAPRGCAYRPDVAARSARGSRLAPLAA